MKDNTCRIPVQATMQKIGGKYVMVSAEYAEIPADIIARFLLDRSGLSSVLTRNSEEQEGERIG